MFLRERVTGRDRQRWKYKDHSSTVLYVFFPFKGIGIWIFSLLSGVLTWVHQLLLSAWMFKISMTYLNLVKICLWNVYISISPGFISLVKWEKCSYFKCWKVALPFSKKNNNNNSKMEMSVPHLKQFWSLAYLVFFFPLAAAEN